MKRDALLGIVERYVSAYNARDAEAILSLYAPDATMEDPVGTAPARGSDEIRALYELGFEMGIEMSLDGRVRTAPGHIAFPLRARSGSGTLYAIDVFELDDLGRIVKMSAIWSPDDLEGEMDVEGRLDSGRSVEKGGGQHG
jgi:steroid delta-isomerase